MAIAHSSAAYRDACLALLPPGAAWSIDPDTNLGKLFLALGDEFARAEQRGIDVLSEGDPRSTLEMMADWERMLALPDTCSGLGVTLQQRRESAEYQFTSAGGQNRQYFIDLAAAAGFPDATITEFDPCTVDETVDAPVYDHSWLHAWRLNAPTGDINQMTVDSYVTESFGEISPTRRLECVINRQKPAHTVVLFKFM